MSQLEGAVKPILLPMLRDTTTLLGPADRLALSRWAVKMSMVIEHMLEPRENSCYWRQEEREAFGIPPHDLPRTAEVLLGRYAGQVHRAVLKGGMQSATTIAGRVVAPMTNSVILCRPLVIYVHAHRGFEVNGRDMWYCPPNYIKLKELRPHVPGFEMEWPPPESFDDKSFAEFARG